MVWLVGSTLAGVLLAAVAVLLLWRSLAREEPSRGRGRPTLRYPVVLAHGVMGFDAISLGGVRHEYFRGLAAALTSEGARVITLRLPPTAAIAARAERLAQAIRSVDAKHVHVIAHSMGGLDARYAISKLGLARRVASLTTVGTPHRGTPIADLGTGLVGDKLGIRRVCDALRIEIGAFYDLTTARMAAFNSDVRDCRGVHYASYIACCPSVAQLNPILLPTYCYLATCAGENDGLVPASSQPWGRVLGRINADHWAQIGWGGDFDATDLYTGIVRELAASGF